MSASSVRERETRRHNRNPTEKEKRRLHLHPRQKTQKFCTFPQVWRVRRMRKRKSNRRLVVSPFCNSFKEQQSKQVHLNVNKIAFLSEQLWVVKEFRTMDDQPKEGGEGDKKITHVYALVKVRPATIQMRRRLMLSLCSMFPSTISNYLSCDFRRGTKKLSVNVWHEHCMCKHYLKSSKP